MNNYYQQKEAEIDDEKDEKIKDLNVTHHNVLTSLNKMKNGRFSDPGNISVTESRRNSTHGTFNKFDQLMLPGN